MNNLSSIIGSTNLAVQGVTYAADIFGFLAGGDAAGSQLMANLTVRVSRGCVLNQGTWHLLLIRRTGKHAVPKHQDCTFGL